MNEIQAKNHRPVILWLYSVAALVFAMVIIGAITRLTDSGLSMVEWRPLYGFLPPMDVAEWNRVFTLYQASPEFQKEHFWMELDDFKQIFFWEWAHRVLGRLIGLAYGLPLLYFAIKKQIPQGFGRTLFGLLLLGGAQGLMGWYMVQSGLINEPAVSHYRLAAHLSLAFLIFALLIWTALSIKASRPSPSVATKKTDWSVCAHTCVTLLFVVVTITWGAFTAGMDAGLVYNEEFPKMGGQWIPETMWQITPAWMNIIENPVGIQFIHRWLGMITTLMTLSLWLHATSKGHQTWRIHALGVMVLVQFSLGVATLLSKVYLPLAVLHQAGALTLLGLLTVNLHAMKLSRHC